MFAPKLEILPSRLLIWPLVALLCGSCAQQGAPTGGPRDEDPPVVVECEPPNYSTLFTAQKVLITFDEYVVLDNVNQELVVSPPMEKKPEVKLRKRTLIMEFDEPLRENTTYTFNFGRAIKDLHEGNQLLNYEYVFSTGEVLDSLSVRGTLKYAEDLSVPEDPVTIMLYNDLRDSVPLTDIPLYVGKSDDSGVFSVNNLRPDTYKVFALKDGNYNLIYDLPTEEIAFLDTSLLVSAEFARTLLEEAGMIDTTDSIPDTPAPAADTIASDTLQPPGPDLNSMYIDLLLFTEDSEVQYVADYNRDDRRKMELVFARPLTDTFRYGMITDAGQKPPRLLEYMSPDRDSLTLWIRDSADYKKDTLILEVRYTVKDSAHRYVTQSDTLLFSYRETVSRQRRPATAGEPGKELLEINTIRKNGELDLDRDLPLGLAFPLDSIRDTLVGFFSIPDTVEVPAPFTIYADTLLPTGAWLSTKWEPAMKYRLTMLPGALSSIYPLQHDTLDVFFSTRDDEYYGQILLNLVNVSDAVLIQLISRDRVVRQLKALSDGQYAIPYLHPQEYRIKFIHDRNNNGKWDTGNYLKKIQPEAVEFLPSPINVRSNWDHEVTCILEK